MEQYEKERRDAINKMKCLKRSEKAESILAARLVNEKMELEIFTSGLIFADVAFKTGIIDNATKNVIQAEIVDDFRKKRKLNTEIETLSTDGKQVINFTQMFASALINRIQPPVVYVTVATLFRAYREFGLPFAVPPPKPDPVLTHYEKLLNTRALPGDKESAFDQRMACLRGGNLKVKSNEKEFLKLFLGEINCSCIKFNKSSHRPDLYELNTTNMRQQLGAAYDGDIGFPDSLTLHFEDYSRKWPEN